MTVSPDSATEQVDVLVLRSMQRVGKTLRGKWRLDRLLGVGGMAAVYAATHRNGSRAALKLLHPELGTHQHVRDRFLKEGYAANRVDHPGVVRVLDDDVDEDGSLFLVMELLDGESLEHRMERLGRLGADEVLAAADQLLDVLVVAHGLGIVHRDIKPENVFLTRDGAVKVLDFGIARLRELSTPASRTKTGTMMGTPAFMAPEQARGLWDEVDGRSDLWAVGATMFSLLTGRLVHKARTTNEQLLAAMTRRADPLRSVAADIAAPVAAIVDRALSYDKEDRFADAGSMQQAVRGAYHGVQGSPVSSHRLEVPPEVENRTLPSVDMAIAPTTASAPVAPTTAGAVVAGTAVPLTSSHPRQHGVIAIAIATFVAAIIVVFFLLRAHQRQVASSPAGVSASPALSVAAPAPVPASPPVQSAAVSPPVQSAAAAWPVQSAVAAPPPAPPASVVRRAAPPTPPGGAPGHVASRRTKTGHVRSHRAAATTRKNPPTPPPVTTQMHW